MDQALGCGRMRIALQNTEEIAFVKAKAITVSENSDILGSLEMCSQSAGYLTRVLVIAQLPAQSDLVVNQNDLFAAFSCHPSSLHSRPSATDHDCVRMHPRMFVFLGSGGKNLAQPGHFTNRRLSGMP